MGRWCRPIRVNLVCVRGRGCPPGQMLFLWFFLVRVAITAVGRDAQLFDVEATIPLLGKQEEIIHVAIRERGMPVLAVHLIARLAVRRFRGVERAGQIGRAGVGHHVVGFGLGKRDAFRLTEGRKLGIALAGAGFLVLIIAG